MNYLLRQGAFTLSIVKGLKEQPKEESDTRSEKPPTLGDPIRTSPLKQSPQVSQSSMLQLRETKHISII